MAKKIPKKAEPKIKKDIVKAVNAVNIDDLRPPKDGLFSPEWLARLIAHIAGSPIDENYKAVFLYTIARGTFDVELYELYIKLIEDFKGTLEKRASELQQKIQRLQTEIDQGNRRLSVAALGACQEIRAAAEHIEKKTILQVEKISEAEAAKEMKAIQERLKKTK